MKTFIVIGLIIMCCIACKKDVTDNNLSLAETAAKPAISARATESRQKEVYKDIDANMGGYLELLPKVYKTNTSKKFPLIIYATAIDQFGNGTTDLYKVATVALPKVIADGRFPDTFIVDNKPFCFIVLSPQFKNIPSWINLEDMINFAVKKYRVDTTRIYLIGHGYGAAAIWRYCSFKGKRPAAVVPITSTAKTTSPMAKAIASYDVRIWAFHNLHDPRVPSSNTIGWVDSINNYHPKIIPKYTYFDAYIHDAWTQATDPNLNVYDYNIYEWILRFKHR